MSVLSISSTSHNFVPQFSGLSGRVSGSPGSAQNGDVVGSADVATRSAPEGEVLVAGPLQQQLVTVLP
jgi:hypothetical protein